MNAYSDLNKQFINGTWADGSEQDTIDNLNPFNGEVINTFRCAGTGDVDRAFQTAQEKGYSWSTSNPADRQGLMLKAAEILMQHKEELVDWLISEAGSTYVKAVGEVELTYGMIIEAASFPLNMRGYIVPSGTPGKESYIYRKALGVVGIISPWNFPLYLSMRSIAPALAVGNTVVVKPASQTPVTGATFVAKVFEEAGLPAGVFNVVVGKSSVIGDYFVEHPASRLITFTGSTEVGKGIGRLGGERLKKLALELGGNNAFLVLDDADVDRAVDSAIFGRFMHQGQICMSTNRILIHERIYEEFKDKFIEKARALPHGNPTDRKTVIGPLIDEKSAKRVLQLVEDSVKAGARLETGGSAEGSVVLPTVLTNVNETTPIFQEEVFGPAVGLIPFRDDEEAIRLANATPFGLSGALHTKDLLRGLRVARRIDTGMVHINDQSVNDEPNAAFGGEKDSGIGRFGDGFILEEMTTVQWISVQATPRQYPF